MHWDYIIVGAGSAGCALAYELARSRPTPAILVLEAGGPDHSLAIRFAAAQTRAMARHDWGYISQPDSTRYGAAEPWPRGRVVGGSSSINGTMYVRGAAEDFDRWAAQCGNADAWCAAEVMRIFRDLETSDQSGPLRGHAGPLHLRTVKRPHVITEAFIKSACARGYSFNDDYNGAIQEGVAYAQLSQRRGIRCSAADAFLRPILREGKIKLLLNAVAQKVELCGRNASAISFLHEGRNRSETGRQIILCAGAIDSPKLLLLSGIGDPSELGRHNISAVIERPGVGYNLREHPLLSLTYRTRIPTYNPTGGWRQKASFAAKFALFGEGPISNLFEAAAFLRSSQSELTPDIQLHFLAFGFLRNANGVLELAPYPSFTILLNKSHPSSRGRIRLASADPTAAPLIECQLLQAQDDVNTLVRGVTMVRAIVASEPIASLIDSEINPGPTVVNAHEIEAYVRRSTSIAFHPSGTCRMGLDAAAVVDPELRVHGTDNLWVADASVMPDLISGNTNAVCMMIGMKLGRFLNDIMKTQGRLP